MRRFWRDAAVAPVPDGWSVALDGKPVHTPGRALLTLPGERLAEAVAAEWRGVGDVLDPRAMPLTGLANAAIDRIAPAPEAFARQLAAYGESDLLCYRADDPPGLVAQQHALWDPPLDWARSRYDVAFALTAGVMHVDQPMATTDRLRAAVLAFDAFGLAGLSPIVTTTGSLVLALWLTEGAADPDTVWTAACCDEDWQADQWGREPLAEQARAARHAEFQAGTTFLALLGD
ncbi:ATPase [Brasilonema bromeliae SPC951]|uniref:ATPase n=1 Tax=Brasilonema bromeliae SPC951 TaxID=385972 RepID=A0ABX1PGG2_9CYAN|nr:ATP12 family protein [Brasilonema bromeliae]NMG22565.1 ATPase [Brasilonema bromeliae SPC951]